VKRKSPAIEIQLHRGHGGMFEVVLDGRLIYSKKATGRFPELPEVLDQIPV